VLQVLRRDAVVLHMPHADAAHAAYCTHLRWKLRSLSLSRCVRDQDSQPIQEHREDERVVDSHLSSLVTSLRLNTHFNRLPNALFACLMRASTSAGPLPSEVTRLPRHFAEDPT
jgi:hypothetical protein